MTPSEQHAETLEQLADNFDFIEAVREAARAGAAALRRPSGTWQPIKTAPVGVDVLVCEGRFRTRVAVGNGQSWVTTPSNVGIHPTHWMPLPAAPTSAAEGEHKP